jgi:hypothetical protein
MKIKVVSIVSQTYPAKKVKLSGGEEPNITTAMCRQTEPGAYMYFSRLYINR